jgi:fucose permease
MNRAQLFWSACGGIFVFGIVLAILGALFGLPEMRARLDIDLAQQGNVFLLLFLGVFLSTIVVGPVIDSFGNKVVLASSSALVTVALSMFAAASSFAEAAIAALVLGLGGGGLNTATNALVADLYADDRGAMLNLLGMFFGFGALFIPLLAAIITGILTIPQLLLVAAGLSAVLTIIYLALRFPAAAEKIGFSLLASIRAAGIPGVMLLALVLLFQSGNESSIGGWTSTYLGSIGAPPRTATWILAGYWGALMIGRMLAAKVLGQMTKSRLILMSAAGSAIGCAVMLASQAVPIVAAGAVIAGLSFAAIYPTTLAIAADRYQRQSGTIFGLLFAVGLIGGMLFPWALGQISQRAGVRVGMVLPLIGSVAIAVVVIAIRSAERRSHA